MQRKKQPFTSKPGKTVLFERSEDGVILFNEINFVRIFFGKDVCKKNFHTEEDYFEPDFYWNMDLFWKLFRQFFGLGPKDALYRNEMMDMSTMKIMKMTFKEYFSNHLYSEVDHQTIKALCPEGHNIYIDLTTNTFEYIFIINEHLLFYISNVEFTLMYPNGSPPDETIINTFSKIKNKISIDKVKNKKGFLSLLRMSGEHERKFYIMLVNIPVKPLKIDFEKHYNQDFKGFHEKMVQFLSNPGESGMVTLHGCPGTGKTNYIRHLIAEVKARFIYINSMDMKMIKDYTYFLKRFHNVVIVLDDGESLLMETYIEDFMNIVNNDLRNLSIKIILSINIPFHIAVPKYKDEIFKPRLIYEFGELTEEKTRQLNPNFDFSEERTLGNIFMSEK